MKRLNKSGCISESYEQMKVFNFVHNMSILDKRYCLVYAVPNGGKRNVREAVNLKKQGVTAGVPDISVDIPTPDYHGLRIEMKVGKNKPTDKQMDMINRLTVAGYKVVICYSGEEAIEIIRKYIESSYVKINF